MAQIDACGKPRSHRMKATEEPAMKRNRSVLLETVLIHLAVCGGIGGGGIRPDLPERPDDLDSADSETRE